MADMLGKYGDVAGAGIDTTSTEVETVPATAGNSTYVYTVPAHTKKKFMGGHINLTTDATAANRRVVVSMLDPNDNVLVDIHAGAVVTASLSAQHHEFMQGTYRETAYIAGTLQVPILSDWVFPAGYKLKISVTAGVAGDSFSGALLLDSVN